MGTASASEGSPIWQGTNSGLDAVSSEGDINYVGGMWILNQVQNDETGSAEWGCAALRIRHTALRTTEHRERGDMNYFGGIWILNQVQNDGTGGSE